MAVNIINGANYLRLRESPYRAARNYVSNVIATTGVLAVNAIYHLSDARLSTIMATLLGEALVCVIGKISLFPAVSSPPERQAPGFHVEPFLLFVRDVVVTGLDICVFRKVRDVVASLDKACSRKVPLHRIVLQAGANDVAGNVSIGVDEAVEAHDGLGAIFSTVNAWQSQCFFSLL